MGGNSGSGGGNNASGGGGIVGSATEVAGEPQFIKFFVGGVLYSAKGK